MLSGWKWWLVTRFQWAEKKWTAKAGRNKGTHSTFEVYSYMYIWITQHIYLHGNVLLMIQQEKQNKIRLEKGKKQRLSLWEKDYN